MYISATVLARCSVFGPMGYEITFEETFFRGSSFERSSFEVLILVSEGPPSFSVATGCKPLQTVSTPLLRHANRCFGTLPPGAAQEQSRSSPGAAGSSPGAARSCPGAPRSRQELPRSCQEPPRMPRSRPGAARSAARSNSNSNSDSDSDSGSGSDSDRGRGRRAKKGKKGKKGRGRRKRESSRSDSGSDYSSD